MNVIGAILAIALGVAFAVNWIGAVVVAVRTPQEHWRAAQRSKGGTIVLILLFGFFAGIYFWVRVRPALRAAQLGAPTEAQLRALAAQQSLGH